MARRGELFERAVLEFYKGLDPEAQVLFDHKVPDRRGGKERQVDVWVTHRIGGHLPINILISCKDHARPLDIGEIDSLVGEMDSTGAHASVLYSRSGFTDGAIQQARTKSIACCRLFENQPPERPTELLLDTYLAYPAFVFQTEALTAEVPSDLTWNPVLAESQVLAGRQVPVCDTLSVMAMVLFFGSQWHPDSRIVPQDGTLSDDWQRLASCPPLRVHLAMTWEWFFGRLNAYRLQGSLNVTEPDFKGDVMCGPIPFRGGPSATAWQRCDPPPTTSDKIRITTTMYTWPLPDWIAHKMGPTRVFGGGPWRFGPPSPSVLDEMLVRQFGMRGVPPPETAQFTMHFGKQK